MRKSIVLFVTLLSFSIAVLNIPFSWDNVFRSHLVALLSGLIASNLALMDFELPPYKKLAVVVLSYLGWNFAIYFLHGKNLSQLLPVVIESTPVLLVVGVFVPMVLYILEKRQRQLT